MSKQEEIAENKLQRELIRDGVILNITHVCPNMLNKEIVLLADNILRDAASQGIVVKVERELPSNPFYFEKDKIDENFEEDWEVIETSKHVGYSIGLNCAKDAGYVAVEPLIESD